MYKTIFVTTGTFDGDTFPPRAYERIDELVALGQTDGVRSVMNNENGNTVIIRIWTDQASAQGWIDWCTANAPDPYTFLSLTIEPVTP
jgi:hypothetical protein